MTIDIEWAELDRLQASMAADTPLYVLNLLRFRLHADYPAGVTPVGESGRDAYFNGYVPAFGAVARAQGVTGVRPIWIGEVAAGIAVAPGERWDAVAIVEYPNLASFRQIVESEAYRATAEPMRRAALEEWRLIGQTKMEMPA